MKITECYISGFGTIIKKRFEFSDSLVTVLDENGSGKSTFASFIKAMFYGLPDLRKSSVEDNDRIKYKPWQGGSFGGTLCFELHGKHYRIERSFGDSGRSDTFRLFSLDTGAECSDFTEDIGRELFGVGADSFEQSTYLSSAHRTLTFPDDIRSKLTGIFDNGRDLDCFENAIKLIDNKRKLYRKLKGKGGLIDDSEADVNRLSNELDNCKSAAERLAELNGNITALDNRINRHNAELERLNDIGNSITNAQARAGIENDLNCEHKKVDDIKKRYPNGFPTFEECSAVNSKISELATANQLISEHKNRDRGKFREYDLFFKNGIPTDKELALLADAEGKLTLYEMRIEELKSNQPKPASDKSSPTGTAVLITGLVLFVAGVITAFALNAVLGMATATAGAVITAVALFLTVFLKHKTNSEKTAAAEYDRALSEQEQSLNNLLSEVSPILDRYETSGTVAERIRKISENFGIYKTLSESEAKIEADYLKQCDDAEQYSNEIKDFFVKYLGNIPSDPPAALFTLQAESEKLKTAENNIAFFLSQLKKYPKPDLDGTELPSKEELSETVKDLKAKTDEEKSLLEKLKREASNLSDTAYRLTETEEQLEKARETLEENTKIYETLELTSKYLKSAKENLTKRYKEPMTKGFAYYFGVVAQNEADFMIDSELNVSYDRDGAMREKGYFSTGMRDMTDICLRLAMIDAMYPSEEKPPLILDDPFVNLDDKHLKNALRLLKKLSEDRRIIYLTCHSSRMP